MNGSLRVLKARRLHGFALPMVVMVIMVMGVMVGVMLDRQNAQMLVYQRQLESYSSHHTTAGFGEAIEAWLRSNSPRLLRNSLGQEGAAFELAVEGGQTVRVSFLDAQGLALADLAGLPDTQVLMGREMLIRMRQSLGADAARWTRLDGPLAISVRSAPEEVMRAAAETALSGDGDADSLVSEILKAREEAGAEPVDMNAVMASANVPEAMQARVRSMFAGETVLWQGLAEVVGSASSFQEPVRYRFWANVRSGTRAGSDGASLLRSSSSILRWERVQNQ